MKDDINNYSDYLLNNELKEKIDELKKEKRKYNFKKALITLRYTLPTISYFAFTLGASQFVTTKVFPHAKYEHIETELKRGSTPKISEPFYGEINEEKSDLILKMAPYLNPDGNGYSRVVYTYNLNDLDINKLDEWLQNVDYSDMQNALKLLPKPMVSVENCELVTPWDNENYEVLIKIDCVNIHKKITSKNYAAYLIILIWCLVCYGLYQFSRRFFYDESKYSKAHFFPESLINALKNLKYSDKANDIKKLEKEIDELVLKLNR